MNYVTLENVSKSFGDKVLFNKIDLTISKGEKIALVAKNGTGKTTLLRVLAGEEAAEGENSKIFFHKSARVSYLRQEPDFHPDMTAMDAVFEADSPVVRAIKAYEMAMIHPEKADELQTAMSNMDDLKAWDFESKMKEILFKLNIKDLNQKVGTLSGGQQKRLALARILIEEPEVLILDEPTNHLDVDMIEWLEEFLKSPNLTLFMVTHDRYFLERVCSHIVELERGNLYKYTGGYSDYLEKKTMRHEVESAELEKTKKLYQKELAWMRRGPKARTTKAKSRIHEFGRIEEKASQNLDDGNLKIDFKTARLGSKIVEANYISKSFDDLKILDNFHYKFKKGERVGIVGPNGVGKSTFIKLLTGQEKPDSGKVIIGETVQFGHYTQEGIQLEKDKKVIEVVRDVAEYIPLEKGKKLTAIQLLDTFLFAREQHQVFVSQLSGGERRRLFLLTILMKNPNFLILDEPTNDLDIMSLQVLEEFLDIFPGCLMIVTHDRYFMDKLVDHLFVFHGNGQVKDFNGDYSEYRKWIVELEREKRRAQRATEEKPKPVQEKPKEKKKLSYGEKREMEQLEKDMEKLEKRRTEILELFNDTSSNMNDLSKELAEVQESLDEKEMRWMELAEIAG